MAEANPSVLSSDAAAASTAQGRVTLPPEPSAATASGGVGGGPLPSAAPENTVVVPPSFDQASQALAQSLGQNHQAIATSELPTAKPGFLDFIAQTDAIGKSLFVVLVCMSLISWYIIVSKGLAHWGMRRRTQHFLQRFWQAGSLEAVGQQLRRDGVRDPFSHLTQNALQARDHHARFGVAKLEDAGTEADFVTRHMRKVIDEETARLESGLTMLASIGSTAPFVGLFGTVWGVYHALVAIGMGGGATIDRIAGPVGEALIMTGLGLAVAIPAVLAFNTFVRRNRVLLSRLDAFAYDLFTMVTTGQRVSNQAGPLASSAGMVARQAA